MASTPPGTFRTASLQCRTPDGHGRTGRNGHIQTFPIRRREGQEGGHRGPTKESLLDLAQDSFSPSLPGQARYQLIHTRTHRQAHMDTRFMLQKSHSQIQRDIPALWVHFNTGQRVLKRDQISTLSPFLILSYQLCPSVTPNLVHWVSAALSGLAPLIKYKDIKLHNCKVSLAIPRSTWYLGT